MIDDENTLLRIFLARCFYSLLYLTHHLTLGFSKRRNPWRSVKVPWRVPWRGKCSLSFSGVREGPSRYREELREEKEAWVRIVVFLIRSCPERPCPALDYTHRRYCWDVIIDGTSQSLRYWRGLVHWVCAAVCIQYLQNSAYWITSDWVVVGVCVSEHWIHGRFHKKTYPNPVKLREAFREAFTLALGCPWPWGGAQSRSSTVRTVILSDPRKSWVSLG